MDVATIAVLQASIARIHRIRRWFVGCFAISLVVLVLYGAIFAIKQAPPPSSDGGEFQASELQQSPWLGIIALLSSCASLAGVVFTTAISWRKEKRESALAAIDLETKKLELQKLRDELQRARGATDNP